LRRHVCDILQGGPPMAALATSLVTGKPGKSDRSGRSVSAER
jgi:hypothetical protein